MCHSKSIYTEAGENGDMPKMEGKRAKKSTGVCDNLEEVDLNSGYIEEDVVDGFLFQSYGKATDLPPMQPMSNPEVFSLDLRRA